MKYLLFNLAVVAALVFLFTADRGAVQKVAGRVHEAAAEMKTYARQALDEGRKAVDRATREDAVPAAEKTADAAAPPAEAAPVPNPPPPPESQRQSEPPKPPAPPPPRRMLADAVPPPAALDPAVAQRRREVLEGIAVDAPAPPLEQGSRMMAPADRRTELLSLAEEMELLYARSVGR